MGDLGLQSAYGNTAMAAQLRQQIADQIAAQERAQAQQQQQFQNSRLLSSDARDNRRMDQSDQYRQDTLTEQKRQHDIAASDRTDDNNRALNDQIPAGSFFEDAPAQQQIIGRLQAVGGMPMTPNQQERPKIDEGPLLPGDTGGEKKRGYLKLASEKQQENQGAADAKVEAARLAVESRTNENDQKAKDRLAQIQAAAAGRPVADKLVKVEHKDPATGRTVIEYLPQSDVRGKTFQKGSGATAESRLQSAEAVNQTGDDIVRQLSNPTVAQSLGPALGRFAKMSDFIGNPPPEFSELAGQIESYALANMGVHGMRSVQGAEKIKALLDARHTPESLAGAIRGLGAFSKHFMENEGRGGKPAASEAKPTAADLIKKYGGG